MLAERGQAMPLQLRHQCRDRLAADSIIREPGRYLQRLEELTGVFDGLIDARFLVARFQAPDTLSVLRVFQKKLGVTPKVNRERFSTAL